MLHKGTQVVHKGTQVVHKVAQKYTSGAQRYTSVHKLHKVVVKTLQEGCTEPGLGAIIIPAVRLIR